MTPGTSSAPVTAWRHVRAITLLPFMNTVVIPGSLLVAFPPELPPRQDALSIVTIVAGIAAGIAGAALVAHAVRLFIRLGGGTLAPWDPTRQLVSAGAYAYSRNPMKGGLFLTLAGEALVTKAPAVALWFACFVLANVVYIRLHEEPGLEARFGDRYRAYCARVPRWWPRLRSLSRRAAEITAP